MRKINARTAPARQATDESGGAAGAAGLVEAAMRALLRSETEAALLDAMCRVAVEAGGYERAWVELHASRDGGAPRVAAGAGRTKKLLAAWAPGTAGALSARSAAQNAARTGKPCIVRLAAGAESRRSGLRSESGSLAVLPMVDGAAMLGVVGVYSAARIIDDRDIEGLSVLSGSLAYGLSALRARARRSRDEQMIERLRRCDELTGLHSRAHFREAVARAITTANEENRKVYVLVIDVDHFRDINEGLGYGGGDRLLAQMGARLHAALPEDGTLARIGEDSFAMLARGDASAAVREAARILSSLNASFDVSGFTVGVRVSIGIAVFPEHAGDPETLILRADGAANEAKHASSGYAVCAGGPAGDYTRRLSLIGDLHHAIENNELLLYCQPKVDMRSRRVCGAEALVRWRHPEYGMIALAELIPLAERTGQIRPLTHWILDAALRQSRKWSKEGLDLPLAVNVSVRNLREPAFFDRIYGLLQRWGTRAGLLQLELTESALMEDPVGALEVLNRLRSLGIQIYIDDFGTGYSSLSYLQKLPIDTIKIDQVFVRDVARSEESAKIVRSTIELAHNLERKVVAEGVEEQSIWDRLVELNCDAAQGYYISKPIPAADLKAWLAAAPWPM